MYSKPAVVEIARWHCFTFTGIFAVAFSQRRIANFEFSTCYGFVSHDKKMVAALVAVAPFSDPTSKSIFASEVKSMGMGLVCCQLDCQIIGRFSDAF
jgi:hypothetical protein